jgi:small subunit ribosomal protein S22
LRFEPDDSEFIRITHRTYEYVNEQKDFEILHSTRFFGPLMFYLVWYKKLDNIIAYMLGQNNLTDCTNIIKLYSIVNEDETNVKNLKQKFQLFNENNLDDIELIQVI